MAALCRHDKPLRTADGEACLLHQPARLGASHGIALVLELPRHTSAPIAVASLRVNGFYMRQ